MTHDTDVMTRDMTYPADSDIVIVTGDSSVRRHTDVSDESGSNHGDSDVQGDVDSARMTTLTSADEYLEQTEHRIERDSDNEEVISTDNEQAASQDTVQVTIQLTPTQYDSDTDVQRNPDNSVRDRSDSGSHGDGSDVSSRGNDSGGIIDIGYQGDLENDDATRQGHAESHGESYIPVAAQEVKRDSDSNSKGDIDEFQGHADEFQGDIESQEESYIPVTAQEVKLDSESDSQDDVGEFQGDTDEFRGDIEGQGESCIPVTAQEVKRDSDSDSQGEVGQFQGHSDEFQGHAGEFQGDIDEFQGDIEGQRQSSDDEDPHHSDDYVTNDGDGDLVTSEPATVMSGHIEVTDNYTLDDETSVTTQQVLAL